MFFLVPKNVFFDPSPQKDIHMCRLGLVDHVFSKPRKKPTAIQMNRPMIVSP